jgi:hypothetical protein
VTGVGVTTSGEITVAGGGQGRGGGVTIGAGGPMVIGGPVDASGGNGVGGGAVTLDGGGDVTTTARLDVGVRNGSADAGTIAVYAAGTVSLQGQIAGQGLCADTDGCVSSGADLTVGAGRSVLVGAQIDLAGAGPDGIGGDALVEAGTDVRLSAPLLTLGKGIDGQGGDAFVSAGRDVTIALVDASGGADGGGTVLVEADGTIAVPGEVNADTRTSGSGGDVLLAAEHINITVGGKITRAASRPTPRPGRSRSRPAT